MAVIATDTAAQAAGHGGGGTAGVLAAAGPATADAAAIADVLAAKGLAGQVDLIVSGLPWQAFDGSDGAGLIPAIAAAPRPARAS